MTIAAAPLLTNQKPLTYDDYLAEGEINRRYDIIDGERIFMTQPTDGHQDIAANVFVPFRNYQIRTKRGRAKFAPCDVLITRDPIRTRQPDVFFISNECYGDRRPANAHPYSPAPELVVEIISPLETRSIRLGKINDYCSVDVKECWLISPEAETVEVLRLTADGPMRAAIYASGDTVQSIAFPDLILTLDDIFSVEE